METNVHGKEKSLIFQNPQSPNHLDYNGKKRSQEGDESLPKIAKTNMFSVVTNLKGLGNCEHKG